MFNLPVITFVKLKQKLYIFNLIHVLTLFMFKA